VGWSSRGRARVAGVVVGGPVSGWSRGVSVVPFWGWIGVLRVNGWVVVGCTGGVDGHHQRWRVRRLVRCGVVGVDHRQRTALPCSMRR
jgi:hypothetical protein